jgi:hypothetical protein
MDHRWGFRLPVDIGVRLVHMPYTLGAGRLREISISGAFVRTGIQLPLLARIRILGSSRDYDSRDALEAYVVRRGRSGYALEWSELSPVALTFIAPELPIAAQMKQMSSGGTRHS